MLKVLLKKQLSEVFKGFFYDSKKNRMRSKPAIAGFCLFYLLILVGVLGGIFTMLSLTLCDALAAVGMGWLFFVIMGIISIVLGAFGSVFNTYAGLYLAKDNDLLLSMPIPVRTIVTARLTSVYLMGAMYSLTVLIPAVIVYWVQVGATAANVICGILLMLVVTVIVLLLSCLLGWVVAKISLKLKNKSFVTVLLSLVFIGLYYFVYFKANTYINNLILHADVYGEKIRGAAYGLYLFGRMGEGDWLAAAVVVAVTAVLSVLAWIILSRSFLRIATSSGKTARVRYVEKAVRQKSVFGAFFGKELSRLTSSATYMLNCGLGVLFIPAAGILLLLKGHTIYAVLDSFFPVRTGTAAVLLVTLLCLAASMNITAAPSVSLEGKTLWIPQSLPVNPKIVLRAKAAVQILLTAVPMLFAGICAGIIADASPAVRLLMVLLPPAYAVFSAFFDLMIGIRMALTNWTNEMVPIKQSGAVMVTLFGGWGFSVVIIGVYLLVGYRLGPALYLGILTLLFAAASFILLRWLDKTGSRTFSELS